MSFRDLLLACNGTEAGAAAMTYAVALAQHFDAHITGLLAHETAGAAKRLAPWIGSDVMDDLAAREQAFAQEIARSFTDGMAAAGLAASSFRDDGGDPDRALTAAARCHDLTLVGQFDPAHDHERIALHPDRIALASGRPLIVVPPGATPPVPPRTVAIAWDGKRAAARAVADALPLLRLVTRAEIVTVGEGAALDDLQRHLDRHGIAATASRRSAGRASVAETLRAAVAEIGADLLVMGAYEHSKFSEDLIGGVTRDMLRAVPVPVLIAH